jgi:hypothetical protein
MMPWREAMRRALGAREWPLLNRYILCGDNLAAAAQPAAYSPFTWIACLLPAALSFTFTGAITFFIAGLGAFAFARVLERSVVAALVVAIGWMFSAPIALHILLPLGMAWVLVPFLLAAVRLVVLSPGWRSFAILMSVLVLEILSGHPETVLHATAIGTAYGLFELANARGGRMKIIGVAVAAGVVALLLSSIYLLPIIDALPRTAEYAIRAVMYPRSPLRIPPGFTSAAAMSDLFPFLRVRYANFLLPRAEGGSILLALAIYAVWRVRSREVWFFAALLVVGFMAGTNAWPVAQILHRLPLFDRALNDRLSAAVPMSLAILAGFAIDYWSRYVSLAMVGVLAAIVGIFWASSHGLIDQPRLVAEIFPLAILAVASLLIKRGDWISAAVIGLLLLQRTIADGSLVPVHPQTVAYPPLPIFRPLQNVVEPFRIVGTGVLLLPNTATMYGLENPLGSAATTLAEYAETYPLWVSRPPGRFDEVDDLTRPILSMLNIRYALTDAGDPIPPGWHEVMTERGTRLLENERVLPRAFIPRSVRLGDSKSDEIDQMAQEADFSQRAWLFTPGQQGERTNGPGRVTIAPARLGFDLDVAMDNPGFVVISEAAWPAWRAYVDGRRIKIVRANHAFLSVYVPAGRHRVRLLFMPQSFVTGRALTFATALLLAIAAFLIPWLRR